MTIEQEIELTAAMVERLAASVGTTNGNPAYFHLRRAVHALETALDYVDGDKPLTACKEEESQTNA